MSERRTQKALLFVLRVELGLAFPSQCDTCFDVFLDMSVQKNKQTYMHGKHIFSPLVKTKMLCFYLFNCEGFNQCSLRFVLGCQNSLENRLSHSN